MAAAKLRGSIGGKGESRRSSRAGGGDTIGSRVLSEGVDDDVDAGASGATLEAGVFASMTADGIAVSLVPGSLV